MAKDYGAAKKKPIKKLILFGFFSVTLYSMVYAFEGTITANFTRGSLYAALPIATAFAFSFVHGSFTNYFWTVLGIEAKKTAIRPKPAAEVTYRKETPQPQPRPRVRV
jgi:hypothetical protein